MQNGPRVIGAPFVLREARGPDIPKYIQPHPLVLLKVLDPVFIGFRFLKEGDGNHNIDKEE